jgi:thiol-disulfide isomerase/thioredoxin
VVGAVLPNPEGISVELDEAKMREIKAGTTPWFIKFYSKRCGHCQALAPTWTELGSQLRNQVNIGEIHCPDYSCKSINCIYGLVTYIHIWGFFFK